MQGRRQYSTGAERGFSLSGLIFVLAVLGVAAIFAAKVFPSYLEYRAAKDGIARAKAAGGSVAEMKSSFDKTAEINNIDSIHGRDLVFTKENGEQEISFAYEKRIALAGNVSLLIDYAGTTDKSGVVAAQTSANAGQ